jgi:hypothetical protein
LCQCTLFACNFSLVIQANLTSWTLFSLTCVCIYTCITVIDKVLLRKEHCRQRAPVGIALSSSGTSQLGMFDIQTTTKSKYYDHIVLLYLEYKHYKGFVYFIYTYRLLFIALFDDFNLIISIFHCLCPSFYLYLSNLLS